MLTLVNSTNAMENNSTDSMEIPSVLTQTKAHSSRSDKYSLIKTSDVIEKFANAGFTHKLIKEEKARKPQYKGFGTHLLCFESSELTLGNELGKELTPRLYFRNSYHGRTSMIMNLGLLRMVCMNGLMLGFSFESITQKHIHLTQNMIDEIVVTMKDKFSKEVVPLILSLKEAQMPMEEQVKFAELALKERLISNEKFVRGEHEKLLTITRPEDADSTYWNVLQRVQENLGLNFRRSPVDVSYTYQVKDDKGNTSEKERNIREVSGIGNVTHLNRFLFEQIASFLPAQNEVTKIAA